MLKLMKKFLDMKLELGSPVEQALYRKCGKGLYGVVNGTSVSLSHASLSAPGGMDVGGLVDRLVRCRPLAFLTSADSFLLPSGEDGAGGFDDIGTTRQKDPLVLERFLSYDEMQLAALVAVAVPTHFINTGGRGNCAAVGSRGTYEPAGVYVALVRRNAHTRAKKLLIEK